MSRSFELPEAEWATVGAVGQPGQRTFYIQARQGEQLVTLKLEKQQVAALSQFLGEILADLPAPEDPGSAGQDALVEPVLAEWAVGSIQLAYDGAADRIVVLAEEVGADDEDAELAIPDEPTAGSGAARIGLTRASAALIIRVGADLVSAGRPTCPLCGRPMDPEGHSCPRTNGHRPH